MKKVFLTIIMTALDWFPVEPVEPAIFPVVADEKEQRKAVYIKAVERAKKDGACTYQSDGKPGSYLPEGRYRLFWAKGRDGWDVYYEESPKIIPRPDFDISKSEDCAT